jgi:hypothetical protein
MAQSGQDVLDSLFNNATTVGLVPSRFERGRIGLQYAVLAAEIVGWEITLDNYKQEDYLATSVVSDNIIKLAAPQHYQTPALASDVMLQIGWAPNYTDRVDTILPFGTIVGTIDSTPIQYTIVSQVTLYAAQSFVWVRARSIKTGLDTMVAPNMLTVLLPAIDGIIVTNPQDSWGGADAEDPTVVKARAMGARYSYEKGTSAAIDLFLSQIGLKSYQYNLIENSFGSGSIALYVDTQIDEYLNEIVDVVNQTKADGIYAVYEKANVINFTFNLSVNVSSTIDMTPEVRNNLKGDITDIIVNFVKFNGVGQNIIASYLIHDILDVVIDKYQVYNVSIISDPSLNRYDSQGNILVNPNEVLEIQNVAVSIVTE